MLYVLFGGLMAVVFLICMVLLWLTGMPVLWAGITSGCIAVLATIALFLWILSKSDFG